MTKGWLILSGIDIVCELAALEAELALYICLPLHFGGIPPIETILSV